jgi:hypothetical protein
VADSPLPPVSAVAPNAEDLEEAVRTAVRPGRDDDIAVEATRLGTPSQQPAQAAERWLSIDSSDPVPLAELMLVGRAPVPRDGEGHAVLIALDDPDHSVSKTHLAITVNDEGVWVIDRGSTNGTAIVDSDGMVTSVSSSAPSRVAPDAEVRFGKRSFTIEIPRA